VTNINLGPVPIDSPITQGAVGILTQRWLDYFNRLNPALLSLQATANNAFGTNYLPLASQPSLGSSDAGYVLFVTDYAHMVYWDGSAWQWLDGDRPGRFSDFYADPGVGWGLCDGSTYALLTVGGASLTTTNVTTPNLSGTAAYKKSGAAYTGTITAASGSTGTGTTSTGTGNTGTGSTGTNTMTIPGTTTNGPSSLYAPNVVPVWTSGGSNTPPSASHTHDAPSQNVTVPSLSVPSLSIPSLSVSVPALGVGTIDVSRLHVLPYLRT